MVDRPEQFDLPDLLGFAGIDPPRVPVVSLEQHLAEKIHSYTRRYGNDQESSRPKDLVDILLISDVGMFDSGRIRGAITRVFDDRATHSLPDAIPAPPASWVAAYRTLASEVGLDVESRRAFAAASRFLDPVLARRAAGAAHWDPASRRWR